MPERLPRPLALARRHSALLAALFVLLAAFAAPYLVPADPDSAVFRVGTLGALLLLACFLPVRTALERHNARDLACGFFFALIFAVCVELGCELGHYGELLPGMGSLLRRLAVPVMAAPLLGALSSFLFALAPLRAHTPRRMPFGAFFALLALCYGAVLLALWPGVISYDFAHEIRQYGSGVYEAAHPVFHTLLLGTIYRIGEALFGSMTAGAALYSVVQLLAVAALYAWACAFLSRRVPLPVTLVAAAGFALLPFHGVLAVSTAKDPLFSALCVALCLLLWEVAEDPAAFLTSRPRLVRFAAVCLLLSLLRHNAVFATLPACLCMLLCARGRRSPSPSAPAERPSSPVLYRRRAAALCLVTLVLCAGVPKGLEALLGAEKTPGSELMSIPCQQLMRTAQRANLTEAERAEISAWFSDATHTYRPHCADPAKGGNFDFGRYQRSPRAFWSMYLRYGVRHPRIYLEAFLENTIGLWYPGDTSHAHALSGEQNEFIYMNTVYPFAEGEYDIEARSLLPALQRLLYSTMHKARHERYAFIAALFCPATYSFVLLLTTLLLAKRGQRRLALTTLPLWGILLSVLFSAGVFVRYAYPIMSGAPLLLALALFERRD